MRKILCIVLALSLAVSLCSCGGDGTTSEDRSEPDVSSSAEKGSSDIKKEAESWEITYQNSKIYKDILDEISCYAIVEVENTGSVDLYLKDASFDFEDTDGKLLSTYSSLISADPEIIAPGEKGYFYCNMANLDGDIDENTEYVFRPSVKLEKAKNSIVRYNISDLSISDGGMLAPVTIIGRVENNTEEDENLVWVACILYRDDGTPIAAYGTNITELNAGDKTSFDASAVYLSDLGIEFSDVSDYKVYAEKTQFQF